MPLLRELAAMFCAESDLGYTYDEQATDYAFSTYLGINEGAVAIAVSDDGRAAGFWVAVVSLEYVAERVCYVNKFYVAPWARGLGVGKMLLESLVRWADKVDCVDTWTSATAGVGEDEAFIGLHEKYGFKRHGPTLRRVKDA